MVTDKDRALLEQAFAVQANAHAPFSNYPVGSAVRTEDGTVYLVRPVDVEDSPRQRGAKIGLGLA